MKFNRTHGTAKPFTARKPIGLLKISYSRFGSMYFGNQPYKKKVFLVKNVVNVSTKVLLSYYIMCFTMWEIHSISQQTDVLIKYFPAPFILLYCVSYGNYRLRVQNTPVLLLLIDMEQ